MPTIDINVQNKIATAAQGACVVCGNSDYVVNFAFDEEWNEYNAKTARFKYNGVNVDVPFTGNLCKVPIISGAAYVEIGVYSGTLTTTTAAVIECSKSVLCNGGLPTNPEESVYLQIIELINDLKNSGVSAAEIAAAVVNRTRDTRTLVTFVDDDGRAEVMERLKPLSEQYGIPFVVAMITDRIDVDGSLTAAQLVELQRIGWEIASHTMGHVKLGELTDEEQETQLEGSKAALETIGLKVDTICYPYSSVNDNTHKIARKYYKCGRCTNMREWLNESPLETWDLRVTPFGMYFETRTESEFDTSSLDYYKWMVDRAVSENAWLIFMTHCAEHDETQQAYLTQTIEYIQSLEIPIVTIREGLKIRGNIVDIGRYNRRDLSAEHFVIGCNSVVDKSVPDKYAVNLPTNFATNDTPPSAFPVPAVSTCRITGNTAGFPYQSVYYGGTLVTNSLGLSGSKLYDDIDYDSGRMWQEFYIPDSAVVYRRCAIDAGLWSDWSNGNDIVLAQDSRLIDDVVSSFPKGIKSKIFITQDGASEKRLDGTNGWLITDRTDLNEKVQHQTWIPEVKNNPKGNIYFRRWNETGWDAWTCIGERSGSANMREWSFTPKYVGAQVFDTTLGKPVWYNGSAWVDATGAEV